jgi:hypothetical protein
VIPGHRQRNYLQSALYVIVAGICATVLLERLLAYAETAEKVAVDATLSRLQAGLYARLAFHALRNEKEAIEAMVLRSPFAETEAKAANYLGELEAAPAQAKGGQWFFDRRRREIVYLPRLSRFLEGEAGGPAPAALRFKVHLVERSPGTYSGVHLGPIEPFRWTP